MLKAKSFKKPPGLTHSVMGVGKNYPVDELEFEQGVKIAVGNVSANPQAAQSDLQYNEYIVYDVGQVKIRFILTC